MRNIAGQAAQGIRSLARRFPGSAWRYILLLSLPGLMLCIIPVDGLAYSFMWQMAALWIAAGVFTLWLSSWWLRAFFSLALVRTATIWPPVADGYLSLLMIAVFLAAIEGFRRIDSDDVMNWICIAGVVLFGWILAQIYGLVPAYFNDRSIGGLNPDAGGVFFALTLPAFLRLHAGIKLAWIPFVGIVISGSTTAMAAALAGMIAFLIVLRGISTKQFGAAVAVLVLLAGFWLWKIDPIENTLKCNRWLAWKHAAWSLKSEALGRGLGSWKDVFPLLASGEKRLGTVTNENGIITFQDCFLNAHNDYVDTVFELGTQGLAVVIAFLIFVCVMVWEGRVGPCSFSGIAALAVACMGWSVFRHPLLALIGAAWIGMFLRRTKGAVKCA